MLQLHLKAIQQVAGMFNYMQLTREKPPKCAVDVACQQDLKNY